MVGKSESLLVLSVDRDNDIGEKTGIKGPIIGREQVLKAAEKLILEDPEDSDANTLFAAVRLHDDLKKKQPVEVAAITGDIKVGVKSDREVSRQLDILMEKTNTRKTIFVTDGAEDEYVLPLMQPKIDIVSIKRVVVRQSEDLEGVYYIFVRFFKEMINEPSTARLFLGIPAIVFLLFAILGSTGWRIVLGVIGVYLLIRGFQLEKYIYLVFDELNNSLKKGRISFFMYIVAIAFAIIGIAQGYGKMGEFAAFDLLTTILAFINGSINTFFFAGLLVWSGKLLIRWTSGKKVIHYLTIIALMFSINIVLYSATALLLVPEKGIYDLVVAIIVGFSVLIGAVIIERLNK